VYPI
jgi:sphingomyelin phosphodiesterase